MGSISRSKARAGEPDQLVKAPKPRPLLPSVVPALGWSGGTGRVEVDRGGVVKIFGP